VQRARRWLGGRAKNAARALDQVSECVCVHDPPCQTTPRVSDAILSMQGAPCRQYCRQMPGGKSSTNPVPVSCLCGAWCIRRFWTRTRTRRRRRVKPRSRARPRQRPPGSATRPSSWLPTRRRPRGRRCRRPRRAAGPAAERGEGRGGTAMPTPRSWTGSWRNSSRGIVSKRERESGRERWFIDVATHKIFTFKPLESSKTPTVYHPTTSLSRPRASRITVFTAVCGVVSVVVYALAAALAAAASACTSATASPYSLNLGPAMALTSCPAAWPNATASCTGR